MRRRRREESIAPIADIFGPQYFDRVLSTSARLLSLLSLLQTQREWPGLALAERLEIDVRTLRRDVDRLRELGYVIAASTGPGGGYRLDRGSTTPPLLFTDDEAVAVALALTEAAGSLDDARHAALGALARIDRLLPPRLRRRLAALERATTHVSGPRPRASFHALAALARAITGRTVTAFGYLDAQARRTRRSVEPLRIVHTRGLYYLVAWDRDRDALRTFRVDRLDARSLDCEGDGFTPRVTGDALDAYIARTVEGAPTAHVAEVAVEGRCDDLRVALPRWLGELHPMGETRTRVTVRADSVDGLVALVVMLGRDVEILSPPSLAEAFARVAQRLQRAVAVRGA